MKKGLLLFGLVGLCSAGLNAQVQGFAQKTGMKNVEIAGEAIGQPGVIPTGANRADYLTNDFSTPADWEFASTLGTQGNFQIANTAGAQLVQYMGAMQSTTNANGFAFFNGVQYLLNNTAQNQDCWVQTVNTFDLTGATVITISFEQRYRAFNADQTFVELSLDGGTTWQSVEVNASVATNTTSIQTQAVNLNIVGTANAKLRFHWTSTIPGAGAQYGSGYGWMVDDVKISDAPANNMILTSISRGEYSKYPVGQERPITFTGKVLNDGSASQTGVELEVTANATSVGTSAPVTVAPFATDSLFLTADYTPSGLGSKALVFTVSQDLADEVPANNTKSETIEVTQNKFSRDNNAYGGNGFGSYTFGGNPVLGVGSLYELTAAADVTSIEVVLDMETEVGSTLQGVVYKPEGNELVPVAESDFYSVVAGDIPSATGNNPVFVKLDFFNTAIPLEAGEYIVAIKHDAGGVSVAYVPNTNTENVLVYIDDSGTLDWFSAQGGIEEAMIRLNVNEAGVGVNENELATLSVYPNPTADFLNIKFGEVDGNATVKIFTAEGKVVMTKNLTAVSNQTSTLDVTGLAAGMYNIQIVSANATKTQKVVIK